MSSQCQITHTDDVGQKYVICANVIVSEDVSAHIILKGITGDVRR